MCARSICIFSARVIVFPLIKRFRGIRSLPAPSALFLRSSESMSNRFHVGNTSRSQGDLGFLKRGHKLRPNTRVAVSRVCCWKHPHCEVIRGRLSSIFPERETPRTHVLLPPEGAKKLRRGSCWEAPGAERRPPRATAVPLLPSLRPWPWPPPDGPLEDEAESESQTSKCIACF